ncbi:hypothetical protein M9H77_19141 [Catharanthus roseus]|uniref:Uncharacterized protein n=1 Tax=Catharanthus roseus TaxID=4058 RepID=A0ACC0B9K2_CATRO|nr:hypothetical protein M9H77_19141 [Catharanthus roseus]
MTEHVRNRSNAVIRITRTVNQKIEKKNPNNKNSRFTTNDNCGSDTTVTPIKQPKQPIYYYNLPTLLLQTLDEQKEKAEKDGSYLLQQESSSFSFRSERLSETTRKVKPVSLTQIQLSISPRKGKPFPLSTKPHARCQGGQPAQTISDRVPKGEREHEQTVGSKEVREKTKGQREYGGSGGINREKRN